MRVIGGENCNLRKTEKAIKGLEYCLILQAYPCRGIFKI